MPRELDNFNDFRKPAMACGDFMWRGKAVVVSPTVPQFHTADELVRVWPWWRTEGDMEIDQYAKDVARAICDGECEVGRVADHVVNAIRYVCDPMQADRDRLRAEVERLTNKLSINSAVKVAVAICREVAELPDRTSPDDNADHMLVTSDELRGIVMDAFALLRADEQLPAATEE